jgi:hypothetical protein
VHNVLQLRAYRARCLCIEEVRSSLHCATAGCSHAKVSASDPDNLIAQRAASLYSVGPTLRSVYCDGVILCRIWVAYSLERVSITFISTAACLWEDCVHCVIRALVLARPIRTVAKLMILYFVVELP